MFKPIYDHVPMERDNKYSLVNTGFYKEDDNISHNDQYHGSKHCHDCKNKGNTEIYLLHICEKYHQL